MTCDVCNHEVAYSGRGAPPRRHPECQAAHRAAREKNRRVGEQTPEEALRIRVKRLRGLLRRTEAELAQVRAEASRQQGEPFPAATNDSGGGA